MGRLVAHFKSVQIRYIGSETRCTISSAHPAMTIPRFLHIHLVATSLSGIQPINIIYSIRVFANAMRLATPCWSETDKHSKNEKKNDVNFSILTGVPFTFIVKIRKQLLYAECLKSNGTVHVARTTFTAEQKALLSMMSQCLMVSKNQISAFVDNYILFCTFFCQGTFFKTVLWKFDKIKNFWFILFGAKDERRTTNQPEISCPSGKNSNWSTKVGLRSLWWWHDVKNSSFRVA